MYKLKSAIIILNIPDLYWVELKQNLACIFALTYGNIHAAEKNSISLNFRPCSL